MISIVMANEIEMKNNFKIEAVRESGPDWSGTSLCRVVKF